MTARTLLHQNRQSNGGDHEDNGAPRCEPRQQVGCATRTKSRLRTLTAKGAGKIGAFALLQQDDDNVDDDTAFCSYLFGTLAQVQATAKLARTTKFDDNGSGDDGGGSFACAYSDSAGHDQFIPSVTKALKTMGQVLGNSSNLAGGTSGALQYGFNDSVTNAFGTSSPAPCP